MKMLKSHLHTISQNYKIILAIVFFLSLPYSAQQEDKPLAFPGAEGFGRFASGGRGGKIITITNLNDSGPGSLRDAVEDEEPRIIVFAVSGYIDLTSPLLIRHGNLTIAGQTAPGDGICLRYYPIEVNADNVIIRYIRSRLSDIYKQQEDAITVRFSHNVIIDHCSFSWGVDECATFYTNENFTLQWCIISESLNSSWHYKGEHGYGGIWGGRNVTFHHNLLAHHKSRNPRFSGLSGDGDFINQNVDFRNNVIYNWSINSSYGGEEGQYNIVNNYYKPGPATKRDVRKRMINPWEPYGKFYVSGNYIEDGGKINDNNLNGGVQCDDPEDAISYSPFDFAPVYTDLPQDAYQKVLNEAGASYKRDLIDNRIINEVRDGSITYKGSKTNLPGIIDSQEDAGGYPELKLYNKLNDSDSDGMPDNWEKENGLDPKSYSDANGHDLHPYYDNVEVYLNSIVATNK